MRDRPPRGRFLSAVTALMLAGLVFAPVATSRDNPHGTPPGQVGKAAAQSNPANAGSDSGSSGWVPPGQAKQNSGSSGSVPPGQAKKQSQGTPSPPTAPAAPSPAASPVQNLTNTVAATTAGQSTTGDNGNPNAPGQIKKAAAKATATVTRVTKIPPGQAKKQAATTTPISTAPATTVTPATPAAVTPAAAVPPATPASTPTSTGTPTSRTGHRHPAARRSSAQRRSSSQGRSGRTGRRATGRGTGTTARRRTAARRVAALAAAGAVGGTRAAGAAGTTGAGRAGAKTARHQKGTVPAPAHHNSGPISNLIHTLIPVPLPVPDWSKPIILALLLICVLLAVRAWMTSRRAFRIDSQRRRLASDLDSLQPALVPEIPASFGPLAVSVAYRPADGPAAGGDFYDVFAVGGGRVAMMVGDVSGHGAHALTRAAHMRYTLRAYMETGLDPRSALKLAGRVLGTDDDALFTTVAVAVYDRSASTMTYATAGHPPPIMLGPAAHDPISVASPALGWGEPTGRRQTTVPFAEGAEACFFSDGVTEVRMRDGLLGREQLIEEVEQSNSATELLERVQQRARAIRDDMAACIARARAGTAISEVRVEELEVHMRHLEAGQGQRFLSECGVSPENASSTLAHARLIAAESGSALLRVEMTDDAATASAGGSAPVSLATPPNLAASDPWTSGTPAIG